MTDSWVGVDGWVSKLGGGYWKVNEKLGHGGLGWGKGWLESRWIRKYNTKLIYEYKFLWWEEFSHLFVWELEHA